MKLDVRDLGGHLDTTWRSWSSTFDARFRLVISRFVLIFALPLDLQGRNRVVRTKFIPCALHGVEASYLSKCSFLKFACCCIARCVWSRRKLLASAGALPGFMDGPQGCDPTFGLVW